MVLSLQKNVFNHPHVGTLLANKAKVSQMKMSRLSFKARLLFA